MDNIVDEPVVWEEVVPEKIDEYLTLCALANFTPKKLVLSTMLCTVSAILRSSKVEYFEDCSEFANIFMLCVGESGCGKSPACNHCSIRPISGGIEREIDDCQIIIDDVTECGIFQSITKTRERYIPLIAIDEAHEFMKNVVAGTRGYLNAQKLCRLYDGGWWSITKGKCKRQRIEDARVATLLFTTPYRFKKEVWDRVVKNKDGLDDRFLFTFVKKERGVSTQSRIDAKQRLKTSTIKQLDSVYLKIFNEHEVQRVYTLSDEARKRLMAFENEKENGDWGSKVMKNALKLILNFHVLYFRLDQTLSFKTDPTPTIINHSTVDMALAYLDILLSTSVAVRSLSSGHIGASVPLEQIVEVMLNLPGPFVTARRTYMKCPSSRRPLSSRVQEAFEQVSGALGTVKRVNSSPVFFKALPSNLTPEVLAEYNMSIEVYTEIFRGRDEFLTEKQVATFFVEHPFGDAYNEYMEEHFRDSEDDEEEGNSLSGSVIPNPPRTP